MGNLKETKEKLKQYTAITEKIAVLKRSLKENPQQSNLEITTSLAPRVELIEAQIELITIYPKNEEGNEKVAKKIAANIALVGENIQKNVRLQGRFDAAKKVFEKINAGHNPSLPATRIEEEEFTALPQAAADVISRANAAIPAPLASAAADAGYASDYLGSLSGSKSSSARSKTPELEQSPRSSAHSSDSEEVKTPVAPDRPQRKTPVAKQWAEVEVNSVGAAENNEPYNVRKSVGTSKIDNKSVIAAALASRFSKAHEEEVLGWDDEVSTAVDPIKVTAKIIEAPETSIDIDAYSKPAPTNETLVEKSVSWVKAVDKNGPPTRKPPLPPRSALKADKEVKSSSREDAIAANRARIREARNRGQ